MNLIKQLTEIGKLTATHGIKGEFKIWINEDISFKKDLINQQVFLQDKQNNFDVYTVEKFYNQKNKMIIKFKNIDSINDAEKYLKQVAFVKTSQDVVEITQTLLGFKVYCANKYWGEVIDIMYNGAHELIKVQNETKQFWVPCVDNYIQSIDWDAKTVQAVNLELLL